MMYKQEALERLFEIRDEYRRDLCHNIKKYGRYNYEKIKPEQLKMLYSKFVELSFVPDSHLRLLDNISDSFVKTACIILENSYLCGHTPGNPIHDICDAWYNDNKTHKNIPKRLNDYLELLFYKGMLTDFAQITLERCAYNILTYKDATEKLLECDRILQITHCRSDLSKFFVEGGTEGIELLSYQ